MIRLWAITGNTFLQTIRQPVFMVMLMATVGLLVFTMPFSGYTMSIEFQETDLMLLQDLGLGTLRVSSLLIAAFSAAGVLRREIEEKTALIVIAKPVARAVFVIGKFLGVLIAAGLAYYICSLVFLMTVRHKVVIARYDSLDWVVIVIGLSGLALTILVTMLGNLWFGWPFTSTAVWSGAVLMTAAMIVIGFVGKGWVLVPFGQGIPRQLLLELAVMFLASVVFVALAVAASTRLSQTMTLLVCLAVFLLGSAHPQIIGRWGQQAPVVRVAGWILPDFSQFYPQDDMTLEGRLPLGLVARACAYCLLYTCAMLATAVAVFQTRELESQESSASGPGLVNFLAWAGRAGAVASGLAALTILTVPALYNATNFILAGAAALSAVIGWLVWGAFGFGRRWSWYLVLAAAAIVAVAGTVLLLAAPTLPGGAEALTPVLTFTATAVAAGIAGILLLPRTRRHFRFQED
jgi:ABC-type transport system involved in multi-copper enzyme maturation permease subunit